jgi:hypothetical protein
LRVSDSEETGLVLRHIDLPLEPGARIIVRHSPGWTGFSPDPDLSPDPQGYTIDVNGDRWRAVFKSSSIGPGGAFLGLEIEGRYPVRDQG